MATRGRKFRSWHLIKADFITLGMSFSQLEKKWNVSRNTITIKARIKDKETNRDWHEEKEWFKRTTYQKKIEEAKKLYIRDRLFEAAKFNAIKDQLRDIIEMIVAGKGKLGNVKDIADIAKAICSLEQTEAILNDEVTSRSETTFSANVNQLIQDISGYTPEQLDTRFKEERKKLRETPESKQIPEKVG